MILSDYHVHCNFSSDSNTPMKQMVERAVSLGFERICFTDHMDYDFPEQYEMRFVFDMNEYMENLNQMQRQYPQIQILNGVECGMQPGIGDKFLKLVSSYPLDFVINSCHVLDHMDPYYPEFWEKYSEQEGIEFYFNTILSNIKEFKDYDVCGHIDYIIRYTPSKGKNYNPMDYLDIQEEILKTVIDSGKGIEANTSGFKYGLGTTHPRKEILKRYRELGGEIITIGSDGHQPEHLAYDFERAAAFLKDAGFRYYTVFKNRKAEFLPL